VVEVYGPPPRLAEVTEEGRRRGWVTRHRGTAVAILFAERLDGAAPEGEARPASLEDAFVVLTGEEIE
jgi:lipooligosaccharide transport system ATP-binding protein